MFDIVSLNGIASNQWLNIAMLIAAVLRVYLEIIKFDFTELPELVARRAEHADYGVAAAQLIVQIILLFLFIPPIFYLSRQEIKEYFQ